MQAIELPAKCLKDVENAGYAEVIEVKLRNARGRVKGFVQRK
jgi:hypothetical protein